VPGHDLSHPGIRVFSGIPAQGALVAKLSQKPDKPMHNPSLVPKWLRGGQARVAFQENLEKEKPFTLPHPGRRKSAQYLVRGQPAVVKVIILI
jgi:hypothetical protein